MKNNKLAVTKEVKEILDGANSSLAKGFKDNVLAFMHRLGEQVMLDAPHMMFDEWMEENNLTDEHLLKAYAHGWETPYVFKIGDVVRKHNDSGLYTLNEKEYNYGGTHLSAKFVNDNRNLFVLVVKDEDRKDKNEGGKK